MMRNRSTFREAVFIILASAISILASCKNPVSSQTTRSPGKWLVLVHMAVDNNIDYSFETQYGFISNYLSTLESLEASDTEGVLEIVVLMDGYTGTITTENDGDQTYTSQFHDGYYHLTGGSFGDDLVTSLSEVNSGGVTDSEAFIDWAWSNYSSDYVVYSVFNHGGGFNDQNEVGTYGIGFDEDGDQEDEQGDCLSHRELGILTAYIKSKTNRNIDLFFPYACLMGGMELGYEVMDSVDYMVFSEETFPAENWSFEGLQAILSDPSISGKELGKAICDSAYNFFPELYYPRAFTLATVDLSQFGGLASALDDFAEAAVNYIDDRSKAIPFSVAGRCGLYMAVPYYTDLKILMKNIRVCVPSLSVRIDTVLARLDSAVTYYRCNGDDYQDAGGLSIFQNMWIAKYFTYEYSPDTYADILAFGTNSWADFVEAVTELYVEPASDEYETDSPYSEATRIEPGDTQTHTFHEPGDEDYLYAELVGGTVYTIQTHASLEAADTYLELISSNGSTVLAYNNDIDFSGGNYYSKIEFVPSSSGIFYFRCVDAYGLMGDYTIDLRTGSYSAEVTGETLPELEYAKKNALSGLYFDSILTLE